MGDASPHFSLSEFQCHGHGVRGHRPHTTTVHEHLLQRLERLRSIVGRPLRIVSGHRCTWWNARQGGARASQHLITTAADIPTGYATVSEAERAGFTGIGDLNGWAVHVDARDRPARWHY